MAKKRILIAEDEEILLKILSDRFEADGWEIFSAVDGDMAIAEMDKNTPDMVLLDLIMPKINGFEVLEHMKTMPDLKNVPVIILSNLGDDESVKKALALGASDYFVKTQHPIGEVVEKAKNLLIIKNR